MKIIGNESTDQEAKEHAAVSPTPITQGVQNLVPVRRVIPEQMIRLGRKNGEVEPLLSLSRYTKS